MFKVSGTIHGCLEAPKTSFDARVGHTDTQKATSLGLLGKGNFKTKKTDPSPEFCQALASAPGTPGYGQQLHGDGGADLGRQLASGVWSLRHRVSKYSNERISIV